MLSRDIGLADVAEPIRGETTVTHHGRWRRTKSEQPPFAIYQQAETRSTGPHRPAPMRLTRQASTNAAYRQQFHYLFLNDYFPEEMLEANRPKFLVITNWLLQLQEHVIQSPALEISIAAFFAARIGRKYHDINLVHKSRSMYVIGLRHVQRALSNPQTRLSDETLAACMGLSFYELTESPGGMSSAYATHQRGALLLLQQRGPNADASPLGHSLFLGLRELMVSPWLTFK